MCYAWRMVVEQEVVHRSRVEGPWRLFEGRGLGGSCWKAVGLFHARILRLLCAVSTAVFPEISRFIL